MDDGGGKVNKRKEEGGGEAKVYSAVRWVTAHCPVLECISVTYG